MNIDNQELYQLHTSGGGSLTYNQLADQFNLSYDSVRDRIRGIRSKQKKIAPIQATRQITPIAVSSMPKYDQPLKAEGEAAILFDVEAPFHEAEFLNRVLDLAYTWKIPTCILGGDVLHFDQFSHWEANWTKEQTPGDNLTPETVEILRTKIATLPDIYRAELSELIDAIPVNSEECSELAEARRVLETLGGLFSRVDFVLGNHDARFMHALNSPLLPRKLLDFIGGCPESKWRVAPFYYSLLETEGETFRIEHPKSAAANTAVKLADKYEMSVIVGHSHLQSFAWSTSGRHYALQAGCIVDETRLAYAAQRSTNRPAHSLGAVIIRGECPYLLHSRLDWERYKRM